MVSNKLKLGIILRVHHHLISAAHPPCMLSEHSLWLGTYPLTTSSDLWRGNNPALFVCLWFICLFLWWFPHGIQARRSQSSWAMDLQSKLLIRTNKSMVYQGIWGTAFFGRCCPEIIKLLPWGKQKAFIIVVNIHKDKSLPTGVTARHVQ